jgi:hypothetical protein
MRPRGACQVSDGRCPENPHSMQCATHPKTETVLKCGRCETPICPRCTVHTPVGARCRSCASNKSSPLFHASPTQYALASLAAVASGLALGWLPRILLLLGPAVFGYAVAEATLRAGGRRRGLGMEIVAGLGALAGVAAWTLAGPVHLLRLHVPLSSSLFLGAFSDPFTLLAVGLSIVCAVAHVRYI